jgi:alkanesulfonate monooxygenase SsuD/methylene tetrahydromethanopterin reductase-like flavin-dependent oxidoreductase (luciferase family)
MNLPLAPELRYGFITTAANVDEARATAERAEAQQWDSVWVGDHVAFTVPIYDPPAGQFPSGLSRMSIIGRRITA